METPTIAGTRPRLLHVHPTRRCNLRCLHCYSSSGPEADGGLDEEYLFGLVDAAAAMGYRAVSFSGGEPLLYRPLARVLRHARETGLQTMLVTNGTVAGRRLEAAAEQLDLLAVSLDGPPDLHNAIRGDRHAFDRAVTSLTRAAEGVPRVGVVYSISTGSWDWMPEAAALVLDAGATFLHAHALEAAGRATSGLADLLPSHHVLLKAYVVGALLKAELLERLYVQVDLVHREHIARTPERFYGCEASVDPLVDPAGAVGVLVVEEDGAVVPLAYGIDRRHRVADAASIAREGLRSQWPAFVEQRLPAFQQRCRAVVERLLASPHKVLNWSEAIAGPDVVAAVEGERGAVTR